MNLNHQHSKDYQSCSSYQRYRARTLLLLMKKEWC